MSEQNKQQPGGQPVVELEIPGLIAIAPAAYPDARGSFMETYSRKRYAAFGIGCEFVQDNVSRSKRGVIRGLHYQLKNPQAKLIQVIEGAIFDVAVDIRKASPTFGQWAGIELSAENRKQLFIPAGFAHGFSVLGEGAVVHYKCSDFYTPGDEYGVHYADPALGINWRVDAPVVSGKDEANPLLKDIPHLRLP